MSSALPRSLLRLKYAKAAEAYLRSLPPEHFMEAKPQATQREISVESLAVLKLHRPSVQYFNELLVQYPHGRDEEIRQVVPDNMVVISEEEIQVEGSFDLPLQPVRPFWMLEYVSKRSERKDYEDSFAKYERELKVPYYLLFYPDNQDLTLYHHNGRKFVSVPPDDRGRHAIPELELEVGLLDGWVRFWYQGKLLPLPADLQRDLDEARRELRQTKAQLKRSHQQTEQERQKNEQLQTQLTQTEEQVRQAQEQARQAQEQAEQERQQRERLLAQLRALGIEPE